MKKRSIGLLLALCMLLPLSACSGSEQTPEAETGIKEKLLSGVDRLEKSEQLYFENSLTITGIGVNFSGNAAKKTDTKSEPITAFEQGEHFGCFRARPSLPEAVSFVGLPAKMSGDLSCRRSIPCFGKSSCTKLKQRGKRCF